MDYATSVFYNIEKPDGFLWNAMIRGFGRTMQVEKAPSSGFKYLNLGALHHGIRALGLKTLGGLDLRL
ncbi:hypothetical protein SL994_23665, partial [Escherichia coli]|uniref:hypothetical protein n=1 Tax=Escherichia coli TaxID=562 RepID=UPI00307A18C5